MSVTSAAEQHKSSAEILSELFSSFNAKPPVLDNETVSKKHKKSKKKHKHKDKKHKKKSKHKYSGSESSDDESSSGSSHKHKSKKRIKDEKFNLDLPIIDISKIGIELLVKKEPGLDNISEVIVKKDPESTSLLAEVSNAVLDEKKSDLKPFISDTEMSLSEPTTSNNKNEISKEEVPEKNFSKIKIMNLKNSTAYEAALKEIEEKEREKAARFEDGELTETENENEGDFNDNLDDTDDVSHTPKGSPIKRSEKSSSKHHDRKRKHSHSSKDRKDKHDDSKKSKKDKHRHSDKSEDKSHSRSRDRDRDRARHTSRKEREREKDDSRREREKNDYYHPSYSHSYRHTSDRDRYRSRDHDKRRSRDRSSHRSDRRRRSKSPTSSIDKKKLLEIARKNAINMLKSGTLPEALTLGPQAQEKVIAAIKAGGKTIEELTDFCKNLSQKEALGELSSVSSNEDDIESGSENEKVFHHPFQIKDKPTSIVMNIKNATPLPVKNPKEKTAELRMQFPVSSGTLHRKTENEWVPVSPKKIEAAPSIQTPALVSYPVPKPIVPKAPLAIMPAPPDNNIELGQSQADMDISSIVSQRLSAMRKLQENPNDVQALNLMYRVQKEMQSWAESKQQPGQFTGSTGAQILSQAELSSGYQAWARKDQLQNAAPVTGGMGMHLLQKMGWKPGEGLGKEKTGSLEPLLLEVKLDKKGLVATEEVKNKRPNKIPKTTVKTLAGKHPVSLLGEYATKRKLGVPQYELCFECGPDHKKNFVFKVVINGTEYKPNVASSTKKQAKSDAATVCLQMLGVLPS